MGGWAVLTRVSGWVVGCIGLAACNLIVGSDVELNVPDAPVIVDPQPDAPMTVADAPATEAPDAIVITACGTTQPLAPCRATSIAVVGDWDGDRKATPGLYDEGRWCITNTRGPGPVCQFFQWGAAGFDPVVGDWGSMDLTARLGIIACPAASSGRCVTRSGQETPRRSGGATPTCTVCP